jgi:hypothetical protein
VECLVLPIKVMYRSYTIPIVATDNRLVVEHLNLEKIVTLHFFADSYLLGVGDDPKKSLRPKVKQIFF